jgi:hypothetical protein
MQESPLKKKLMLAISKKFSTYRKFKNALKKSMGDAFSEEELEIIFETPDRVRGVSNMKKHMSELLDFDWVKAAKTRKRKAPEASKPETDAKAEAGKTEVPEKETKIKIQIPIRKTSFAADPLLNPVLDPKNGRKLDWQITLFNQQLQSDLQFITTEKEKEILRSCRSITITITCK